MISMVEHETFLLLNEEALEPIALEQSLPSGDSELLEQLQTISPAEERLSTVSSYELLDWTAAIFFLTDARERADDALGYYKFVLSDVNLHCYLSWHDGADAELVGSMYSPSVITSPW